MSERDTTHLRGAMQEQERPITEQEAPRRIWMFGDNNDEGVWVWYLAGEEAVAYVRADIADALLDALRNVAFFRGGRCWCESGHVGFHQGQCVAARAAIDRAAPEGGTDG